MKPTKHSTLGRPRRSYVYAWWIGNSLIYVGSGAGTRAVDTHHNGMRLARAERWRRIKADRFRAEVLTDGMSRLEARRLERHIITVCRPIFNC